MDCISSERGVQHGRFCRDGQSMTISMAIVKRIEESLASSLQPPVGRFLYHSIGRVEAKAIFKDKPGLPRLKGQSCRRG